MSWWQSNKKSYKSAVRSQKHKEAYSKNPQSLWWGAWQCATCTSWNRNGYAKCWCGETRHSAPTRHAPARSPPNPPQAATGKQGGRQPPGPHILRKVDQLLQQYSGVLPPTPEMDDDCMSQAPSVSSGEQELVATYRKEKQEEECQTKAKLQTQINRWTKQLARMPQSVAEAVGVQDMRDRCKQSLDNETMQGRNCHQDLADCNKAILKLQEFADGATAKIEAKEVEIKDLVQQKEATLQKMETLKNLHSTIVQQISGAPQPCDRITPGQLGVDLGAIPSIIQNLKKAMSADPAMEALYSRYCEDPKTDKSNLLPRFAWEHNLLRAVTANDPEKPEQEGGATAPDAPHDPINQPPWSRGRADARRAAKQQTDEELLPSRSRSPRTQAPDTTGTQ